MERHGTLEGDKCLWGPRSWREGEQLAVLSKGVGIEEKGQEPWGDLGQALQAEGAAVQRAESRG